MTNRRTRSGIAMLFTLALAAAAHARAAPLGHTQTGPVTGVVIEDMNAFLGIRYAAPPVGPLRWRPPQPVPPGLATMTATRYGAHCAQTASTYATASATEDCLFLNVFTPRVEWPEGVPKQPVPKLPVMVWIHGGALVVGESDNFDPSPLIAAGDVIVVTVNYRLGYFGFLATAGLDAEGHAAGNYGLQDQQFALDWVRRNIAGFGGDPDRVTIFGESAGGLSTLSNLVSPAVHGLFSRAIVQSGTYALTLPTLAQAEAIGAGVARAMGCNTRDTACLRSASVPRVLAPGDAAGDSITTIVDGTTLPLSIDAALKSGRFNHVPIMNGSNRDEFRLFLPAKAGLTASQYPGALAGVVGDKLAGAVAGEYPVSSYPKPVLALAAALSDRVFACTARQVDRWAASYVPVYGYEFNDRQAPQDYLPPAGYPFGAYHAAEIQFLFHVPERAATPAMSTAEIQLSGTMAKYWTNFAESAAPDSGGVPAWAAYATGSDVLESLQPGRPDPEADFAAVHHCAFWQNLIQPS